jgi:1-acyl-sn-glycerol-3-phosphate acyltransferase
VILGANARWFCPKDTTVQRVYFANHTSHLDTLLLWSLLPPQVRRLTRPVAAKEHWDATCVRRFVAQEVFNAVLIARPDQAGSGVSHVTLASQAFTTMLEAMGETNSLIIFPEGTRGSGQVMRPFKSGLYHLACHRPGLEMIPVYLENLNRILPKGELLPVPLLSSVSFGAPLHLGEHESKTSFLERARHAIEELTV